MFTDGDVGPAVQVGAGEGLGDGVGVGVGVGVGLGDGDGVGVGVGVGLGPGAPVLTVIFSVCLKTFPAASFACTVKRCVPAAMVTCASIMPPFFVSTADPST